MKSLASYINCYALSSSSGCSLQEGLAALEAEDGRTASQTDLADV